MMDDSTCDGICHKAMKLRDDIDQHKQDVDSLADSHKALQAENARLKSEIERMRARIKTAMERGRFERELFKEWL